jgi:AraC family transcriptional regulator, transcriptional activator of pobA
MKSEPALRRRIRTVEFHRTKYGRELLVDVIRARDIPELDVGGLPHVLQFYEIFLITKGRGAISLDGRTYRLSSGSVFFTSPGQPRHWRTRGIDGLCLFFTADFVEDFFKDPLFLYGLPYFHRDGGMLHMKLRRRAAEGVARRFRSMKREIDGLRADSSHALRAALYECLVQLDRAYTDATGAPQKQHPTAIRLRRLIEQEFQRNHQPRSYARKLGITVGHLNQLAHAHLGRGVGVAIRSRLAVEAKRRLVHTDVAVAEVGEALGFKDPAYFARFFKREVGISPSSYRAHGNEPS